ncbi:PTPA-CTERM sorting domain-containing protein [Leptolyngbya ohadii]|uniref:PTPA-CTERM sorting domain-containing protein n=1 Tax=Leptolyngbya ohadii TaxID=1962290 RepID=UPI000B599A05|nr:PTPA-CTERM sorting domain-containing protein [Leptolyngbya ohadii]
MNLKSISSGAAVVGAAALTAIAVFLPTAAQAFTVTFGGTPAVGEGLKSTVAGVTTVDFEDTSVDTPTPFTSGGVDYSGAGRVVQGSIDTRYKAPDGDSSNYLTVGGKPQEPGPVTLSFDAPLNYFGLYWGSIDSFNSIRFFRGDTLITGFGPGAGLTSISTLFGGQGVLLGRSSRYVNFFADNSSEWFDRIILSSSTAAFESDNHAYRVVPTPALVPAALGFGAAMLRKRKKTEEDAAEA